MDKFYVKFLILDPPLSTIGWVHHLEVIKIYYVEFPNCNARGTLAYYPQFSSMKWKCPVCYTTEAEIHIFEHKNVIEIDECQNGENVQF